jgi:RNA polymerase sigma-70 factor (ECF subfamily)
MAERIPAEQSPDIPERIPERVPENFPGNDISASDFAGIVHRHQSAVFSIALHFLADRSAAEELAQDVFLQLHANLATMKSEDHMKFWLRKVTAHRCIDHKRRRRLPQISLDDAPEPAAPTQSSDPFLARRLRQYVASLPEKPRLVMILRYQEDMPAEDIAEVLTMPLATVKSHLQRSLAMLREKVSRGIGEAAI